MKDYDFELFIKELDLAQQTHIEWTHRILRCVVTRTEFGQELIQPDAHKDCTFGRFLLSSEELFNAISKEKTFLITQQHKTTHDAIREIGLCIAKDINVDPNTLDVFEHTQQSVLSLISFFKSEAMTHLAPMDALTKLPLRQHLDLDFKIKSSLANQKPLVVMLVDIDHFKNINDKYGHNVGDQVIQELITSIKPILRASDRLYRYGGDEFVILMHPESPDDSCLTVAERIRSTAAELTLNLTSSLHIPLSVTIGVTKVNLDEPLKEAIERADQAMYQGKVSGRNRCVEISE
ncbi:diguanylate cyclase domain-containing protein [Marinomonas epiphytica]